jgi:hypothetical protein
MQVRAILLYHPSVNRARARTGGRLTRSRHPKEEGKMKYRWGLVLLVIVAVGLSLGCSKAEVEEAGEAVGEAVEETTEAVADTAEDIAEGAVEMAEDVAEGAGELADDAAEVVDDAVEATEEAVEDVKEAVDH